MAEGFNLTTYYAKRIIGDTAAVDAEKALLQTGDGVATDTWILHRTNRTDKLYGIKYKYDSDGHDKMEYYGQTSNDNATAWIQFDTGDASFNNILGKIYVTATSLPASNNIIYYLTYTDNATSGHQDIKNSNRLYIYEDTTSTYFNVGSSSTSGGITIHNANGNYSNIISSAFSDNRTVTLPNEDGTFALLTKTDINALINLLDTGSSVLTADDYIITQYVGGGTTTTTYHRRAAKNVRVGGLTTARSLWGNSFDGTADISGNITISGSTSNGMAAGSANPHITFVENGTTQPVHLIYTDLDSYRSPAGLKVVGGASATPAWFEVEGDVYFGGDGIYHVGTAKTQRIVRIIDANDQYGTGISIGAGGLTILGGGESTNKMIDNLGYTGASEVTVISSDGIIGFYPSQNDAYDASSYIYMQQNKLMIGVNGNTTRESGLYVQSGAGQIELFSSASATGTRGLWVAAHGTGSSKTIISADTNNNITYAGGAISGQLTRAGVLKSWYQGRDSAIIKTTSYSGYDAILSMKTTAGDWALGVYTDNIMYFTYILDSNYSSNTNTVTKQFIFNPNGTLTATTFSGALNGNASTATKATNLNCSRVTKNVNEHPGKNITRMQEFSNTSANLPSSHFYYILEAQGDDPAYSVQLAMGETASAIYYRAIQNNTYNSWNRIVTNSGSWSISVTGSSGSCTGNAATATNADKVDNYHASDLWRKDGGTWNGNANIACTPTANNQEYSFDLGNAHTGTYWHVWSGKNSKTILACYNDNMNVSVPNGTLTAKAFSGPLTGNVTGNCSGSSGSCTGNSNTANYQNCVDTNEIRYARNGNMQSANDLWQGWAFAEGKVAVINGWRFGNGNGALAPIYGSKVYNAIWNDFAEYRESDVFEGGRVLVSDGHGKLVLATERLQPAARVISDTFGCSVGQSDKAKTPIGVAGRVLVYPYQDRNNYKVGDCLCAAPNGTADIMTREEIINYPDRIIGIVDEIPTYEVWQQSLTNYKKKDNGEIDEIGEKNTTDTKVNGRIWIYVR